MFWTENGRGKKERGKEKSVVMWVDEKKRGEKNNFNSMLKLKLVSISITIFSQYFHNKYFHNIFTVLS